ncbi:M28 family metallopeptidase [Alishewanella sp. HL-SH05]|uniref:M28 family metallopeptidase n=1 Tax=Alishewanella sp. HL-SH05 TaxID=3461145 RepID=UPI0040412423
MKKIFLLCTAALMTIAGCSSTPASKAPRASALVIESHLTFLADDLLEGRDTGSRGHELASRYIAQQFQALGLVPAAADGTYFQRVPMRKAQIVPGSAKLSFSLPEQQLTLDYPQQFTTGPNLQTEAVNLQGEMVFVGYGLVSEVFGLNDYANLDVKGKVVVMLSGLPAFLPSEERAYLGSMKTEFAVERGAIGVISVHTPQQEKTRPYADSLMYLNSPSMSWLDDEGNPGRGFAQLQGGATLHPDAASLLFAAAGYNLSDIFALLEKDEVPKGFALKGEVNLSSQSTHQQVTSPNVLATLPGSDPLLKEEYVVLTAHSDHIGFSNDLRSEDKINNGAMDNAAGIAILLETARLFAQLPTSPKRSILFAAVTGEEKGLLGADYLAKQPPMPISQMVANVNLDMPVLLYSFADLIAFGANHSTLGDVVARAAAKEGRTLSEDPMPEQAIFTRSDHYRLVQQGVPAVFLMTGFTSTDPKVSGGKVWASFFAKHYHRPSDDIASLTKEYGAIRYDAGAVFADINFNIALDVANAKTRPLWRKDSFFRKVFGRTENSEPNTP